MPGGGTRLQGKGPSCLERGRAIFDLILIIFWDFFLHLLLIVVAFAFRAHKVDLLYGHVREYGYETVSTTPPPPPRLSRVKGRCRLVGLMWTQIRLDGHLHAKLFVCLFIFSRVIVYFFP